MISNTSTTLKHAILRTGHVCVLCARAAERADEQAAEVDTRRADQDIYVPLARSVAAPDSFCIHSFIPVLVAALNPSLHDKEYRTF
jgi:hypothetical protein